MIWTTQIIKTQTQTQTKPQGISPEDRARKLSHSSGFSSCLSPYLPPTRSPPSCSPSISTFLSSLSPFPSSPSRCGKPQASCRLGCQLKPIVFVWTDWFPMLAGWAHTGSHGQGRCQAPGSYFVGSSLSVGGSQVLYPAQPPFSL